MDKFYEIICGSGVIGVTRQSGNDDAILHAAQEDDVTAFGQITKAQFDRFNDDKSWTRPISKRRWAPTIKRIVELKRIK